MVEAEVLRIKITSRLVLATHELVLARDVRANGNARLIEQSVRAAIAELNEARRPLESVLAFDV